MISDFLPSLELHIILLYSLHIVLSIISAIIVSSYNSKRFINGTEEISAKDKHRLEEIVNKSLVFRLLFRVSLHKNNRITNFLFIFLFNLAMPIIGYFLSAWIAWYLNNIKYDKKVSNTNILNLDEFGISFLKVERIFGEGSMGDLMTSEYAPKSKKLKALSSLANNPSPANLRIIRQTLSSTDDEIRMFGYAIINKAEKLLNIKINYHLERFNEEKNKENSDLKILAHAAKELAPLYWELVYTELSHESLKDNFKKDVVKYIEIAKEFYLPEVNNIKERIQAYNKELSTNLDNYDKKKEKEKKRETLDEKIQQENNSLKEVKDINTRLYILMGRLYMSKNEYANAKIEFNLAQSLHEEQLSFILPYLAEIYFATQDYKVVNTLMNKAKDLELNATLYPIVDQWKQSS